MFELDPNAEVIALSPTTLMARNRFVCEICNKGFQRDQNLQLHRRGHNLPWKLKQRTTTEVRKRVYICPEPTCVHHNSARALGDLTGIKKHFSRKHGEKKWKCDKCSKKYAVQSDWKAHQKTCGTREYKCDCGTIFSRFIYFILEFLMKLNDIACISILHGDHWNWYSILYRGTNIIQCKVSNDYLMMTLKFCIVLHGNFLTSTAKLDFIKFLVGCGLSCIYVLDYALIISSLIYPNKSNVW